MKRERRFSAGAVLDRVLRAYLDTGAAFNAFVYIGGCCLAVLKRKNL
jgi:hypothetical protein